MLPRMDGRFARRDSVKTSPSAPPSTPTPPSSRSTRTGKSRDSDPIAKNQPAAPDPEKAAKSAALKREFRAIALLLFGVFLAGAMVVYAIAESRTVGVDTTASIGWVGRWLVEPLV